MPSSCIKQIQQNQISHIKMFSYIYRPCSRPSFNQQMLLYSKDTRWIGFGFDCYVKRGMKHEQMNTPLYQKTFLFTQ